MDALFTSIRALYPHRHPDHDHELVERKKLTREKCWCDYCGLDLQITSLIFSCRRCDYDLCHECHGCPDADLWERLDTIPYRGGLLG